MTDDAFKPLHDPSSAFQAMRGKVAAARFPGDSPEQPKVGRLQSPADERAVAVAQAEARVRAELQGRIAELEAEVAQLRAVQDGLVVHRRQVLADAAQDVADLVLTMARKVVGDSLALHPDALVTAVRRAVRMVPEEQLRIRVPVHCEAMVRQSVDPRLADCVVGDPTLEAGCVVESARSGVDSSLDAVMEGLENAVAEWLETQR